MNATTFDESKEHKGQETGSRVFAGLHHGLLTFAIDHDTGSGSDPRPATARRDRAARRTLHSRLREWDGNSVPSGPAHTPGDASETRPGAETKVRAPQLFAQRCAVASFFATDDNHLPLSEMPETRPSRDEDHIVVGRGQCASARPSQALFFVLSRSAERNSVSSWVHVEMSR